MLQPVLSLSSTYPLDTDVNSDSNQIAVHFLMQIDKRETINAFNF